VLLAAAHLGYGRVPLWLLLPLSVAGGFAVAALMCRVVEAPSIALGKALGRGRREGEAVRGLNALRDGV
jgi:peptidoglycan/LPS O-acetylase OafA/YrhL